MFSGSLPLLTLCILLSAPVVDDSKSCSVSREQSSILYRYHLKFFVFHKTGVSYEMELGYNWRRQSMKMKSIVVAYLHPLINAAFFTVSTQKVRSHSTLNYVTVVTINIRVNLPAVVCIQLIYDSEIQMSFWLCQLLFLQMLTSNLHLILVDIDQYECTNSDSRISTKHLKRKFLQTNNLNKRICSFMYFTNIRFTKFFCSIHCLYRL